LSSTLPSHPPPRRPPPPLPPTHSLASFFSSAGITDLRSSKEKLLSSIDQLETEKEEIEDVLPILINQLLTLHKDVEGLYEERSVYDNALKDMFEAYDMLLQGKDLGEETKEILGGEGNKRGGEEDDNYEGYGNQYGQDRGEDEDRDEYYEEGNDPMNDNLDML
jgi:hypothetical protein